MKSAQVIVDAEEARGLSPTIWRPRRPAKGVSSTPNAQAQEEPTFSAQVQRLEKTGGPAQHPEGGVTLTQPLRAPQAFTWLAEAHPLRGGPSALLRLLLQMWSSPGDTPSPTQPG